MADIQHYLIADNLQAMSTKDLREMKGACEAGFDGIMSGLKAFGECAYWACSNENYADSQAKADLCRMSEALMCLPKIAQALIINAENAQFTLYQREGFPVSEGVR
ncbi:hypothetical protein QE197_09640 [Arsenophonus nasoniae]|uniref:Uncharacterized protein n=2 Tax=Arsenophonus nasoniae TaxID=638 RepID=A0A4P7KU65_9GAMM|nr:hypothetical protein [Arsenophonus nasoniae]QBY42623.1 hypothetical protein ArsFIN_11810 [Arsenophonus nasoniae]QBY43492.1 hypothetical protein ArsFIN_20590 [Arsenophonus nasoniae]QBY43709.1 hypothetical protein ArsFIN_22770 [Arsenophonus nasoniae]QBY44753.1 hypothetical protein ArsFIN_33390 [Arsenophonus nasoniae]WGM05044.1 hypothetical protein QE258_15915 [Arsenophonus nasoniae]